MPNKTDSLDIYAQALGYTTEREMLKDLYENLGLSTTAIARILEVRSQSNVRIRLMRAGIKLRKRGGYMGRRPKETTQDGIRSDSTNGTPPQVRSGETDPILPCPPV